MIPVGDATRRPVHFPSVTLLVIASNLVVFLVELYAGDPFVSRWAVVPARVASGHGWLTIVSAMFMHASWLHILGNMVFFWAFAPEIEDVMGPIRFLAFYILGGAAATLTQVFVDPASTVINLGASGAIAAVMGAFLITFPRDRIRTILLIGFFIQVTLVPAILLVGLWFIMQVFSEVGSIATSQAGGVAYMAHVGGFIFGVVAARVFETRKRRYEEGLE